MGEIVEVDSQGRIVIPSSIRNKFGLKEGTQLAVETKSDGIAVHKISEIGVNRTKSDNPKDFLSR